MLLEISYLKCFEASSRCDFFYLMSTSVQHFSLPFWNLSAHTCQIEISRHFSLLNVHIKHDNCSSARRTSVADAICSDTGIMNGKSAFLNDFFKLIMLITGTKICCVHIVIFYYILVFMCLRLWSVISCTFSHLPLLSL